MRWRSRARSRRRCSGARSNDWRSRALASNGAARRATWKSWRASVTASFRTCCSRTRRRPTASLPYVAASRRAAPPAAAPVSLFFFFCVIGCARDTHAHTHTHTHTHTCEGGVVTHPDVVRLRDHVRGRRGVAQTLRGRVAAGLVGLGVIRRAQRRRHRGRALPPPVSRGVPFGVVRLAVFPQQRLSVARGAGVLRLSAGRTVSKDDVANRDDGAVTIVVARHGRSGGVTYGGADDEERELVRMRPNTAMRDLALPRNFLKTGADCDALPRLFPNLTRLELCLRSYTRAERRSTSMAGALSHLRALEVVRFISSTDGDGDGDEVVTLTSEPHSRSLPPAVASFAVRRSDCDTDGDTDAALDASVRRPDADLPRRDATRVLLQLCAVKNARLERLALTDPRAARLARPLSRPGGALWPPLRSLSLSQNSLCGGVRLHTLLSVPTLECLTLSRMDLRGEEVDSDTLGSSFATGSSASMSTRVVATVATAADTRVPPTTATTKTAMRHVEIDQCLFTHAWLRRILAMYTALVTLHLSGPRATKDPREPADGNWLLESVAHSAACRDGHLRYLQIANVTGANPLAFAPPNAARPRPALSASHKLLGAGPGRNVPSSPSPSSSLPLLSRTIPIVSPAPRIVPDPNRSRCSCRSTCDNCICVRTRVACDDKCHRKSKARPNDGIHMCGNRGTDRCCDQRRAKFGLQPHRDDAVQCRVLAIERGGSYAPYHHLARTRPTPFRATAILVLPRRSPFCAAEKTEAAAAVATAAETDETKSGSDVGDGRPDDPDSDKHVHVTVDVGSPAPLADSGMSASATKTHTRVVRMRASVYLPALARILASGRCSVGFGPIVRRATDAWPAVTSVCGIRSCQRRRDDAADGSADEENAVAGGRCAEDGGGGGEDDEDHGDEYERGLSRERKVVAEVRDRSGNTRFCYCEAAPRVWTCESTAAKSPVVTRPVSSSSSKTTETKVRVSAVGTHVCDATHYSELALHRTEAYQPPGKEARRF